MEGHCSDQTKSCAVIFNGITESLNKGNARFVSQEEGLKHLQNSITGPNGLCSRISKIEDRLRNLELNLATTTNKILAGIAVACVLLAINAAITYIANGGN